MSHGQPPRLELAPQQNIYIYMYMFAWLVQNKGTNKKTKTKNKQNGSEFWLEAARIAARGHHGLATSDARLCEACTAWRVRGRAGAGAPVFHPRLLGPVVHPPTGPNLHFSTCLPHKHNAAPECKGPRPPRPSINLLAKDGSEMRPVKFKRAADHFPVAHPFCKLTVLAGSLSNKAFNGCH